MSHGNTDRFNDYLKGEHFHVPTRISVEPLEDPVEFVKQSFSEHDLHSNNGLQFFNRVIKGAVCGVLFTIPVWGHKSRLSTFATKMMSQQSNNKLGHSAKNAFIQIQPYAMTGAAFGLFSHIILDWTGISDYNKHMLLSCVGGALLARTMPNHFNSIKTGIFVGMGYSGLTQHIKQMSTISKTGLKIADPDRTPEEAYKAAFENYMVNLTHTHSRDLNLQHFEKL